MTLEQVFYLTQSVAAVGVIASLIFLGLQTRDPLVRTSHCSASASDLLMALVRSQARSTAAPRRFGSVRLNQCTAPRRIS
jgi:hypothetical protein